MSKCDSPTPTVLMFGDSTKKKKKKKTLGWDKVLLNLNSHPTTEPPPTIHTLFIFMQ